MSINYLLLLLFSTSSLSPSSSKFSSTILPFWFSFLTTTGLLVIECLVSSCNYCYCYYAHCELNNYSISTESSLETNLVGWFLPKNISSISLRLPSARDKHTCKNNIIEYLSFYTYSYVVPLTLQNRLCSGHRSSCFRC